MQFEELSPHTQKLLEKCGVKSYRQTKLVADFHPRKGFGAHFRYVKTALEAGLKMTKLHQVIKFRQEPFISEYIQLCINERAKATNTFDKYLFKLCQNAVFGKFLESSRNYKVAKFAKSRVALIRQASLNTYTMSQSVNSDVVLSFFRNEQIVLENFPAVGCSILDLSKEHMWRAFYNDIVPSLEKDEKLYLSFGDTGIMLNFLSSSKN